MIQSALLVMAQRAFVGSQLEPLFCGQPHPAVKDKCLRELDAATRCGCA